MAMAITGTAGVPYGYGNNRYCWSSPSGNSSSSSIESNKSSSPLKTVSGNFTDSMKWLHLVLLR
jgi:hypothetical protein